MIIQLGGLFGQILAPVLQAGLQIGGQFLNRELSRDARRQQKDLLKAQARAAGGGSFVDSQSPGTVSSPFVPATLPVLGPGTTGIGVPVRPAGFGIPGFDPNLGDPRLAGRAGAAVAQQVFPATAVNGGPQGPPVLAPGGAAIPGGVGNRFVLDKRSGCLRVPASGEKATHKIDFKTGDFVRIKPRRMNPLNFKATSRAARRVEASLRACKQIVTVTEKMKKGVSARGKVVKFRTRRKKRSA